MSGFYINAIIESTIFFLSIFTIILAISMFKESKREIYLLPWKFMISGIVFLGIFEIVSVLRTFEIYENPYLTKIITAIILISMLIALILVNRTAKE